MNSTSPGTRRWRRVVWGLCLCVGVGVAACTSPDRKPPPGPVPATLSFEAHSGAEHYRVQAWSNLRLLFEVTVTEPQVTVTPALARALEPFEEIELEVQALGPDGERLGAPVRRPVLRGSTD